MAIMSNFLSNSGLIFSKISKIKQENPSLSARKRKLLSFLFCIKGENTRVGAHRQSLYRRRRLQVSQEIYSSLKKGNLQLPFFIFRTPLRNQKPTFQSNHNETASITRREQPQRGLRPMDVIADAYGNAHKDIRHNTCCKEKPTERA